MWEWALRAHSHISASFLGKYFFAVESCMEIEIKFRVQNLPVLAERLDELDAVLIQPRTREENLRFDTPDGRLQSAHQVLRLRQDSSARLTFKGPSQNQDGVRSRQEIEFSVGEFEQAHAMLQALGYQVWVIYEKYRREFDLDGCHVALDELPYGNFIEIEGPDAAHIKQVAHRLALDWQASIPVSYLALFEQIKAVLGLSFNHLTFDNFDHLTIPWEALGVRCADHSGG